MTRTIIRRTPVAAWPNSDSLLSRFFAEPFSLLMPTFDADEGTLAVDVAEDDTHVYVRASLPGFRREDVAVEVHDGVVSIKAEHAEEREEKTERFYRRERSLGSVSRRVALPSPVLEDEAQAELKDGVLELRLPKTPQATPRRVSIK